MSKKTFTFFIIGLVALLAIVGWYILNRSTQAPSASLPTGSQNNLFPFGQGPSTTGTNSKPTGGKTGGGTTIDLGGASAANRLPRLRHVSLVPSAGAVAFDVVQGSSTLVNIRYVERATGHIFETPSEDDTVSQISSVTLPKIHEALWNKDGGKLLLRYTKSGSDVIRTFYGKISSSSPDIALEGLFLPDGLKSVSVQGDKVFYLDENSVGAQGIEANIDNSKKISLFNSTFGDWAAVWGSPAAITLYSHPSGAVQGSAYVLNSSTGQYAKAVGEVLGLTALANNDGSLVLYSGADGRGGIGTAIIDPKTGAITSAGLSTITDKCIWSQTRKNTVYCAVPRSIQSGTYPDDWYKGNVSFDDALWTINAATGETTEVVDPALAAGVSMDMINLSLDQKENVLVFLNKNDMTVWRYDLVY